MANPSLRPLALRLLWLSALLAATFGLPVRADNPAVTVVVDAGAGRHPIDPLVYGIAYGDEAILRDLNCPLNRLGGNNTSRYNWRLNADNRGSDWYFESIGDPSAVAGERGDSFVAASLAASAQPMLTVPMIGWVAKVPANRTSWRASRSRSTGPRPGTIGNGSPTPATASGLTGASSPATTPTTRTSLRTRSSRGPGWSTW
jgi:Glycoside hydrolase family 44